MSLSRLACLAFSLTLLTACAGNQGEGQGPDPEPNQSGAPDAPAKRPADTDEGPRKRTPKPRTKKDELEVRIRAPRDGASFGKAPIEVIVEVTHRGELRSLTLEGAGKGLKAEALAREELDKGREGGDSGGGASGGGSVEDGDVTFSQTAPGGSDADKTIARAKVAKKVIERILGEWSFSALRGERRREVVTQAIATLRRERFKKYRGKYRYTATVNMPEARNLVLDAFAVERTFGAEPYLLVAEGASWFKGAKLSRDEVKTIRGALTTASADWLNRWRFKQAGTGKLDSGALLQRGPLRESTYQGLGATYNAGLVVVIKGGVAYQAFKGSNHATAAGFKGYLRTKGLICVVYDRTREQIAATFTVKSSADKRSEDEATTDSAHQPWIAKGSSVAEEAERYSQFLGRLIASNVMRRLCADYYANLPAAPSGAILCPGCGDLCPAGTQRCPACDSPLGPGGGASAPAKPKGPSLYRSRYRWLIKNPKVGKNKLRVVAVDSKGRTGSDRCTFSFTPPDTEPPVIKVVKPRKGMTTGEKPVEVIVEASDARGLTSFTVNGKSVKGARGKRRFTYRFNYRPREGNNDLEFEARDAAGNRGRAHTSFTYVSPDVIPPTVQVLSPKRGAVVAKGTLVVKVQAYDDRGVRQVMVGKTPAKRQGKTDTYVATIKLPREGKHSFEVTAVDTRGNRGRDEVQVTFRKPDTTPPTLTLLAPKAGSSLTSAPIVIAVRAKDDRGVKWVKINGVNASQDSKGRWRVQIKNPREGNNAVEVQAADAAGNTAKLSSQFLFDSTPPEVEASASLTVKGVMKDLEGTLTINGQKVEFDKQTGAYEAKVKPHPDHPDKVVIVATDELGNRSERIEKVR
jgi:glucodextranase-like protein